MKKKTLAAASLLLALLMPLGATPLAVYADEGEGTTNAPAEVAQTDWYVSRSKTATELDDDDVSHVTLSLPSAEEKLSSDVVFVLDTSDCVSDVMTQVSTLVTQLETAQKNTEADIKVGAVIFNGSAYTMFDGKLITAASAIQELEKLSTNAHTEEEVLKYFKLDADSNFIYKGSNLHAGLRAAQKLLDADTTVKNGRKYLVSITDGMTYYWNDNDDNVYGIYSIDFDHNGADHPTLMYYAWCEAHNIPQENRYKLPDDFEWDSYLEKARAMKESDNGKYNVDVRTAKQTLGKDSHLVRFPTRDELDEHSIPYIPEEYKGEHAHGIDCSVMACLDTYQEMVRAGYQCYTLNPKPNFGTDTFPGLFTSKLNEMANKDVIDFTSIQNDILYAVDAGSKVEDTIGNEFTLDTESLSVTVGGTELTKTTGDNNTWVFGDESANSRFVVEYNAVTKTLTWRINENVSNFARVQLRYNVKLTNPKTEAGTHKAYTNERAILYPVNSNVQAGAQVEFPKPEVSYTIYALNYDANGGDGAPAGEVNCTGNFTVSDTAPTRDGYVFAGWNTEVDGSGTNCAAGSGIERSEDSPALTLYAQWNKLVTVSFDLCGHGGTITSQTFVSGGKASEPTAPKEDGWVFGGWYTEKGCQNRFSFDSAVTSDITLYAKWDRVTTVVSAPVATPTPTPTPSPAPAAAATKTATVKNAAIPQTSDVFPMEGLLALLAVGAVGFGAAGWLRKKHH